MRGLIAWGVAVGIAAAISQGCSEQSNKLPGSGSASTAAGLSSATAPQGPFPRGQVDPKNLPDPAKQGPTIKVVDPARGAQVTSANVDVTLEVKDPDGVTEVLIAGRPATALANDQYRGSLTLTPGVTFVDIVARDQVGNRTTGCFSLTHGQFHPADAALDRCVAASLNNTGLSRLADVLTPVLQTLDLQQVVTDANPLFTTIGTTINALALAHDPITVRAEGVSGGLKAVLRIKNVRLDAEVNLIGIVAKPILVADEAVAVVDATIDTTTPPAPGSSSLQLQFRTLDVTFQNFRVTAAGTLSSAILGLLTGPVQGAVAGALEDMIRDEVAKLLAQKLPGIDTPLELTVPMPDGNNPKLGLTFKVHSVDGSPSTGLGASAGFKFTAPTPAFPGPNQFLVSGQQTLPVVSTTDPFTGFITADAVNGLLHAFWMAGGLQYTIDGASTFAPSFRLEARFVSPFIPVVKDLAPDPATPLLIKISAAAAPIVGFGKNGRLVQLTSGETELSVFIDYKDGKPPLELFTARVPLQVGADVSLVQGREIRIENLTVPKAKVDVIREPAADLADQEIEDFVDQILPWAVDQLKVTLPAIPLPALPAGLKLSNVRADAQNDVLAIRGGF